MESSASKNHFDLVSPEALRNPFPVYQELREHAPVYWEAKVHGWIITRYDDVTNCLRDSRLTINRTAFYEGQLLQIGLGTDMIREFLRIAQRQMSAMDGPDHLRLRRQSNPGFSPQALDSWRPTVRRIMEMLMEQVQGQNSMDLAQQISYQLPTLVISEMLGVPSEDRERFQKWADPMADFSGAAVGKNPSEVAQAATAAMVALREYLIQVIEERRKSPGYDLISRMIDIQEGGTMSQQELVANLILFLVAGHLTTTDQLSNAVHLLLNHPDQLNKLREDPSLIRSALEEIMRYEPALPFTIRVATQAFQLRGQSINKGDVLFLGMAAANRDPAVFPDPERFDITRDHMTQKHMSFGFGSHHCLGAGLARRELEIALEVLMYQLPALRLDETKPPKLKCHTLLYRGFDSLPVQW
jgi:cytochrome P450 PksS